jgi:tetratricopeptide (TPR) repeat protein
LLRTKQASVATYLQARGERSNQARLLDEAQAEYDAGRYSAALDTLKQMLELSPTARILQAWATYRLGNIAPARALFNEISQASSNNNDARAGVAYCALRENDLAAADSQFAMIMKDNPNDPAALFGLGLVRYRQGRLREAATSLESSIKIDSTNEEARAILKRIRIAPNRGEVK